MIHLNIHFERSHIEKGILVLNPPIEGEYIKGNLIRDLFDHFSGRIKHAENANNKNTIPPINVTVFGEIRCETNRPPITAKPVHKPWPIVPPIMTPRRFSLAARTMVVI